MASVKISELNTLISISSDDFIPIVDSGSGTTYRATFNVLNNWMAASASCLSASYAVSSSYAVSASYARSSSWADLAGSSSYALTASYYNVSGYTPVNATSASYATTASSLQGNGLSWERDLRISGSLKMASGSTLTIPIMIDRIPLNVGSLTAPQWNSIFFNSEFGTGNDFSRIYYMESTLDKGRLYFDLADNIDSIYGALSNGSGSSEGLDIESIALNNAGFVFSSLQADGYYATGSLLFIKSNGKVYGRGFEARDYSQSLVNQVGFYGTASHAITASYIAGAAAISAPPIGTIVDYAGAGSPVAPYDNWLLCDGSEINRTTYASLFSALSNGTIWGIGNGTTTFNLPDLRMRMTLGAGTPATSNYLGAVGDTGGSENVSSHYHLVAKTAQGITPNGATMNDDLQYIWVNNQTVNMTNDFPIYTTHVGGSHGVFWINGPIAYNYTQPDGDFGNGNNSGFIIGTSFGFVVGTSGHADLNPPYAVCNKIIRAL